MSFRGADLTSIPLFNEGRGVPMFTLSLRNPFCTKT